MDAYRCDRCRQIIDGRPPATIERDYGTLEEPNKFDLCWPCFKVIISGFKQTKETPIA